MLVVLFRVTMQVGYLFHLASAHVDILQLQDLALEVISIRLYHQLEDTEIACMKLYPRDAALLFRTGVPGFFCTRVTQTACKYVDTVTK